MNSFVFFAQRAVFALALALAVPAGLGVISVVGSASAVAAVASSVSVRGNQRIEAETIRTYITIKPGKSYGAADIDESVKVLYGTGLFADVSIVQQGGTLVVTVVENPVINSVVFEGNKKVKANILASLVDLKTRGVLTDAKLQSDVFRIEQYYSTTGRSAASVDARVTQLPNNRADIVFVIAEGERTGVSQVNFVGNSAFSTSRLTSVVQTRKTNWLSWLNKSDIYSEEKLQADAELLRRFYLKHGYADFQVLSQEATFDDATGKYYVTFTLDEGPKFSFGTVTIDSSLQGVDPEVLMGVVKTKSGRVFDSTFVEKSTEDLTIELARMGYVFAQVRPRGDRNYTNNTLDLTYVIDDGARAYIERIDIRGNTRTRDYVIRREFDVSEGDAYNRVLINKAERRLRDLGYFKSVAITTEPGSAPDRVVVVVGVEDQSTGSFSVAGGVQTSAGSTGLIAEVAMEETNFLGRGQTVRLSVGGGLDEQTFNASFNDPYFLGNRLAFGFDAYRARSKASTARPFATDSTGGGFRLGLPLTDETSVQLNYKIANITVSGGSACDPTNALANPTAGVTGCYFPNGSRLTSSLGYVLTYSTIDSTLDPHEGVFVRFSQDFAGAGGAARYIRSVADARYYRPILPDSDVVGMVKVSGGNITGLGQTVATADNFFKGGETVRGFASLGYGPRDTSPAGTTGAGMAVGGKNFVSATAEVQFPLPMVPPDFGLRGAVFADAGMLFGADVPSGCVAPCSVVDDNALRTSVGGSIIWASPFGQIRADFAQAINKQSYDKTEFFRIGAGGQF